MKIFLGAAPWIKEAHFVGNHPLHRPSSHFVALEGIVHDGEAKATASSILRSRTTACGPYPGNQQTTAVPPPARSGALPASRALTNRLRSNLLELAGVEATRARGRLAVEAEGRERRQLGGGRVCLGRVEPVVVEIGGP